MSDRLHTHTSYGFKPNCPACDQVAAQLQAGVLVNSSELVLAV
jgi:hypothetical protein